MELYKFNNIDNTEILVTYTDRPGGKVMPIDRLDNSVDPATIEPFRTDQELKVETITEAELIYKNIKENLKITVDTIRFDMRDRFDFDYQKRGGGGARVRQTGGAIVSVGPALANSIESETSARLNALADAFNADIIAIESGNYSLSNLKIQEIEND